MKELIEELDLIFSGELEPCNNRDETHTEDLYNVITEIVGNSIEWSGTQNKQWILSVKYEKDFVVFSLADVGKGILKTIIKRKQENIFTHLLSKPKIQILEGAFQRQHGSASKEDNRNLGLPFIHQKFEECLLKDLKVVTNNVILCFNDPSKSIEVDHSIGFKGTLYRWVVDNRLKDFN